MAGRRTSPTLTRRDLVRLGGLLGISVPLAPVLAACSQGSASTGGGDGGGLSVMNRWSEPTSQANADALFEAFTEATGVSVANQTQPNSGSTYQPAVRNAFSSSDPPSLATTISGPEVYNLARAGVLLDLTGYFDSELASRAQAGATAGSVLDDQVWGISSGTSVGNCVWFNPDYLDQYGLAAGDVTDTTTWLAAMTQIKEAGGTPIVIGAKDQWPGGHYLNHLVQRRLGSVAATALYNRTVLAGADDAVKWTDDQVVAAFQDYLAFQPLFPDGFLGEAAATADGRFLTGESAFYSMGSWFLSAIRENAPAFSPGVMLFPAVSDGDGQGTEVTLGNETLIASADADTDAVEAFLEFFTRPETLARWAGGQFTIMPFEFDPADLKIDDPELKSLFTDITGFSAGAGPDGAALFNDQAIDVNVYTQYIWQGSVGLMAGEVAPEELAQQLEDATVAAQEALS